MVRSRHARRTNHGQPAQQQQLPLAAFAIPMGRHLMAEAAVTSVRPAVDDPIIVTCSSAKGYCDPQIAVAHESLWRR